MSQKQRMTTEEIKARVEEWSVILLAIAALPIDSFVKFGILFVYVAATVLGVGSFCKWILED